MNFLRFPYFTCKIGWITYKAFAGYEFFEESYLKGGVTEKCVELTTHLTIIFTVVSSLATVNIMF